MSRSLKLLLLLAPGLGVVLFFLSAVLYRAVAQSFGLYDFAGGGDALTLAHWREVLSEGRFWRAFRWSAYIATTSAVLAVALAYPIALWLRKPFRRSHVISALLKAPLLVPGLVAVFLLVNIISFHGFVNEFFVWIGIWDQPHRMQNDKYGYAIIALQVWKQMSFAFLLLSAAVQAIPEPVLHAAQDLGAGTMARFRKVIMPMTVGSMQAALVLIFIGAAGDFSFQAVSGPPSEASLATLMTSLQTNNGDWNGADVVAVMLMALALFGSVVLAGTMRLFGAAAARIA